MRLRIVRDGVPPVDPAVAAILLSGWMASPPDAPERIGFGPTLDIFIGGDEEIIRLWRLHETYLRQLAAVWGVEPTWRIDGIPAFFAEFVGAGGR